MSILGLFKSKSDKAVAQECVTLCSRVIIDAEQKAAICYSHKLAAAAYTSVAYGAKQCADEIRARFGLE